MKIALVSGAQQAADGKLTASGRIRMSKDGVRPPM
jgi:hypothetical protein